MLRRAPMLLGDQVTGEAWLSNSPQPGLLCSPMRGGPVHLIQSHIIHGRNVIIGHVWHLPLE